MQDTAKDPRYGTTIPVWLCRGVVEPDEHVMVVMGDNFFFHADGASEAGHLIGALEAAGGHGSAMIGVTVPREQTSDYGIIAVDGPADGVMRFRSIQERPAPAEARSDLANVSTYLFDQAFFAYLDRAVAEGRVGPAGEYFITDQLNEYVAGGHRLLVVRGQGQYLDGGTTEKWLHANNTVAAALYNSAR